MLNVVTDSLLGKRGATPGNSPQRGKKERTDLEQRLEEENAPGWVKVLAEQFEKLSTKVDQFATKEEVTALNSEVKEKISKAVKSSLEMAHPFPALLKSSTDWLLPQRATP